MKTTHRVSLSVDSGIQAELRASGVSVDMGFASFELDDETWQRLAARFRSWGAVHIPRTKFTARELSGAAWLRAVPTWHHGYPQPDEDDFGYLSATYRSGAGCTACGVGRVQEHPFRMRREPKWGSKAVLQLHWVFDEFFVTPDLWGEAFAPKGVESTSVLDASGKKTLRTVVQLRVLEEARLEPLEGGTACADCKATKYPPITHGLFPVLADRPSGHIVRTREFFGSGANAANAILISQILYAALKRAKVKGAEFVPLQTP
jgi:hypothetical protein